MLVIEQFEAETMKGMETGKHQQGEVSRSRIIIIKNNNYYYKIIIMMSLIMPLVDAKAYL